MIDVPHVDVKALVAFDSALRVIMLTQGDERRKIERVHWAVDSNAGRWGPMGAEGSTLAAVLAVMRAGLTGIMFGRSDTYFVLRCGVTLLLPTLDASAMGWAPHPKVVTMIVAATNGDGTHDLKSIPRLLEPKSVGRPLRVYLRFAWLSPEAALDRVVTLLRTGRDPLKWKGVRRR